MIEQILIPALEAILDFMNSRYFPLLIAIISLCVFVMYYYIVNCEVNRYRENVQQLLMSKIIWEEQFKNIKDERAFVLLDDLYKHNISYNEFVQKIIDLINTITDERDLYKERHEEKIVKGQFKRIRHGKKNR